MNLKRIRDEMKWQHKCKLKKQKQKENALDLTSRREREFNGK